MIEFAKTPYVHFFLCRQCRAHIALALQHVHTRSGFLIFPKAVWILDFDNGNEKALEIEASIFRDIVNVDVEDNPRRHRIVGMRTAADACCTRCGTLLGFKWIFVPNETMVAQAGRFVLSLRRLLLWDGRRILYGHTLFPVED